MEKQCWKLWNLISYARRKLKKMKWIHGKIKHLSRKCRKEFHFNEKISISCMKLLEYFHSLVKIKNDVRFSSFSLYALIKFLQFSKHERNETIFIRLIINSLLLYIHWDGEVMLSMPKNNIIRCNLYRYDYLRALRWIN